VHLYSRLQDVVPATQCGWGSELEWRRLDSSLFEILYTDFREFLFHALR
jgi:hypothetical protein